MCLMPVKDVPTEKKERNQALYTDFKSGKFMIIDLVAKYRISTSRIYQIVNRMQRKDLQS